MIWSSGDTFFVPGMPPCLRRFGALLLLSLMAVVLTSMMAWADDRLIAVTAFAMKGDEEKIRDGGCDAYIGKPIRAPEFLETVERVISVCAKKPAEQELETA